MFALAIAIVAKGHDLTLLILALEVAAGNIVEHQPALLQMFVRAAARSCRQRGGLKMLGRFREATQKWRQGLGPVASEEDCRVYGASI